MSNVERMEKHLRDCAADPMWADHCEMRKSTVTAAADHIAALVAERDALRDCRTCAHFTTKTIGCLSMVQCVNAAQYKATAPWQYWQIAQEQGR